MFSDLTTEDEGATRPIAPEFPSELEWVNVREPLALEALRGRVVLLYFWSYSNIHCTQALADLKYLEGKYREAFALVGAHVPKFAQERASANVMRAINRHYIRHPVVSDPDFVLWQLHRVEAWPTYVVLDAQGRVAAKLSGEGRRGEIDAIVAKLVGEIGWQEDPPPPLATTARPEPKTALRFPGKLLATADRLYVSDTGHNRILECTHEGRVLRQFGSGNTGFWDGRGAEAAYCEPQGLAIVGNSLFVADRGNHAVRRVTISTGETITVLGTGVQGRWQGETSDPRWVPLSSPWALAAQGDRIYIALAGQHQIGLLDLVRSEYSVFGGNGREDLVDGPLAETSFAKPLGLAQHAQTLYVADAASSSIRAIKLFDSTVKTITGTGLHEAGDAIGARPEHIKLQHPSSLAVEPRLAELWIADSFNGKLKVLSLRGGASRVAAPGHRFHEPAGLSIAAGAVWVANTNAHEIVRIDLADESVRRVPVAE